MGRPRPDPRGRAPRRPLFRSLFGGWYADAVDLFIILLGAVVGLVLLLLIVWLLVLAYVKVTGHGGTVERFLESGEGELPSEERVKHVGGFKHGSA
jgi:hypothetical protein